uniref:NADH dehydrogenase [ubiquinone] 1 beta subcomplex subunit 1 n=1 Tax=Anolis carolinensis TaxID=28377 RepID=A0A803TEE5_ANOCA
MVCSPSHNFSGKTSSKERKLHSRTYTMITMVNILQLVRDHWGLTLVPIGFVVGCYFDRRNDEKLSLFRNKSKLYHRELKPGEEVTWR